MKRSEAQQHKAAREAYSAMYECFSVKNDESGEPSEEYFSHSGCDVCSDLPCGGAGTVIDVVFLSRKDTDKGIFNNVYDGQLCGGCLCSLVNGDDSDLDYSTTSEE